ncbi:phenylpyruvate tautomerase MIF-related protein [Candidatus Halobeggiatoa sp. HSG11]|nr:phenylpyruvate tautomerase MIF-related protein [Candidatus Halobeggiatoa sp. HSG11]
MPYLQIQTNIEVEDTLLANASQAVADILGKPESYVMIALQTNIPMLFAGSEQPMAHLTLKSINLPTNTKTLSSKLCTFIASNLKISPDRIYIEFVNVERTSWGWNERTF